MLKKKILGLSLMLIGCSSANVASGPQNYAFTSVVSAVEKAMSMGIQKTSPNHREFYSRPFLVKQSKFALNEGLHERGLAKVVILGESRPYTLDVEVSIQRAKVKKDKAEIQNHEYSHQRYDKRLANDLILKIISILDKRERNKNVVDDFRSF
ncbi:MAG: hypothetical protein IPM57_04705 [Oligoflexia bacterium]|nr:hypothetical protein [Oligoflexia bacterium]